MNYLKTKTLSACSLALSIAVAIHAPISYADEGFQLSEKLAVTGFIDMSYTNVDSDDEGRSSTAGVDQFELDFLYNFSDKLTAQVDLEYQDGNEDKVDIEQAYFNYAVSDALSIKAGRFLSYSGWETEEPTGLYQFSGTGYAPIFYGYYQQGVSALYSQGKYALALSIIADLDNPNDRDFDHAAYEIMAAIMPTDDITVKGFYLSGDIEGTSETKEKINVWASYAAGPLTLAAEYNIAENSYELGTESDGYLLMANYDFDYFGLTLRYHAWEVEYQDTGILVEDTSGVTIAPSFAVTDNLSLIFEYRIDKNKVTDNDTNTFAIEALLTF